MSRKNRTLGRGSTVKLGESDYRLSALTQNIQGDFESWYIGRVRAAARGDESLMVAIAEKQARGEYDFWSPASVRAVATEDGSLKLFHLLLKDNHPKITESEARELVEKYPDEVAGALHEAFDLGNPSAPAVTN